MVQSNPSFVLSRVLDFVRWRDNVGVMKGESPVIVANTHPHIDTHTTHADIHTDKVINRLRSKVVVNRGGITARIL